MINIKEQRVLDFIEEQSKIKGYPPSIREICIGLNIKSTSTVHMYIAKLADKGCIEKQGLKTRAIRVLNQLPVNTKSNYIENIENVNIPLVGNVAAGAPILAEENIEEYFSLPQTLLKRGTSNQNTYMLKVKGESMIEAGIFDGDYIIVNKQNTASNGEIIVALIEDEATVKTFYKEKDHIRLQPQNNTMQPIIVKDVTILGKVVGLFRRM